MRFLADGPDLPDELLTASDEGRVLFFCGAGVSRARANLPDFIGLAKAVLDELRVQPESPAYKLFKQAEALKPIDGVGGLPIADRVFGLLEREFTISDIDAAVGKALNPGPSVDLSAHRTLLDLSRDQAGNVRLVTTNFDLLFDIATTRRTRVFAPNNLPDLRRGSGFDGIVHLHGMFDAAYSKSVGGSFVLSSAEFGRAYLSEGWATEFILGTIKRYVVVFVGYGADDPPVQYLLEALSRTTSENSGRLYAFQSGREDEARARWGQKGVRAIAYPEDGNHQGLWKTLEAWSQRARNPERWRTAVIRRSIKGPENLERHERGQLVHLAGTEAGAKAIALSTPPLPATWLCVFDPRARYASPGTRHPFKAGEAKIDPFDYLAIDSDPAPVVADASHPYKPREVPSDVVNVLGPNSTDDKSVGGHLRGDGTRFVSDLSPRLSALSAWISNVCGQPAAAWWAAGQLGLHPIVVNQIHFTLNHRQLDLPPTARAVWRYLFEGWRTAAEHGDISPFDLNDAVRKDGWTEALIRRYAHFNCARLKVSRSHWGGVLPPTGRKWPPPRELIEIDVEYPERHVNFEVPDEQLATIVALIRKNLEHAANLELETSPLTGPQIVSITPDPNLPGDAHQRDTGINGFLLQFIEYFQRLKAIDTPAARREFGAWHSRNDPIFGRLRVWAARLPDFLDDEQAAEILVGCDDGAFWSSRGQRDLLLSLQSRWSTLPTQSRVAIEQRLLGGPKRIRGASAEQNRLHRAIQILDRVTWLTNQGCRFGRRTENALSRLRASTPQWKPEEAERAVDSIEARGGFVHIDKSIGGLADVPIDQLIAKAMASRKREWGSLQDHVPFAGLIEKFPVRVLAALMIEVRKGTDAKEAWEQFLYDSKRREENPKVAYLIGRRLLELPEPTLESIIRSASYWLDAAYALLFSCDPATVYDVFDRVMAIISRNPDAAELAQSKARNRRDWSNTAFGSPAGHLGDVLLNDPSLNKLAPDEPVSPAWIERAQRLVDLPGDHGRYGLLQLARNLGWLHAHEPQWSEDRVVAPMLRDGEDGDAAFAGFYLNPRFAGQRLYLLLKPKLIEIATATGHSARRDTMRLAEMFIGGWLTRDSEGNRWLSDSEFRRILIQSNDELRGQALWHAWHFQNIDDKIALLTDVWPKQLSARSPAIVGRLCTLAFQDVKHFKELAAAIMPLVATGDGGGLTLPFIHDKTDTITKENPEEVLALLAAVLSDNVRTWPYGVDQTMAHIVEAKSTLAEDPRFRRLMALWEQR